MNKPVENYKLDLDVLLVDKESNRLPSPALQVTVDVSTRAVIDWKIETLKYKPLEEPL